MINKQQTIDQYLSMVLILMGVLGVVQTFSGCKKQPDSMNSDNVVFPSSISDMPAQNAVTNQEGIELKF